VQNTGHADLVQRADGSWAMVYLGVRARGGSPQWHVLGRETFGSEIIWEDGWPRLGAPITPTGATVDVLLERLVGPSLPPSWLASGRFPNEVFRSTDGGWQLTATAEDPAADDLSFVGRRQEHLHARVSATVRPTEAVGGLSVRIDGRHHLDLEVSGEQVRVVAQVGEIRSVLGERAITPGTDVTLHLRLEPARSSVFSTTLGPDLVVAGVLGADGFIELGHLDGRYLSTELAGGFTGRMIGMFCREGVLEVRSVEYHGADSESLVGEPA
jgi:hypothetical protein